MTSETPDLSRFRADFPALARRRGGRPPIYLNSACVTLRPRPVIEAIARYYETFPTCGGGRAEGAHHLHSWFGEELQGEEEQAREAVRELLGAADVSEIVWTRNTTEAINLVARGLGLQPGDEVLGSEGEHNSNLVPWLEVQRRLREQAGDPELGVRRFFDLAEDGTLDVERALAAISPLTRVLAISQASSLDGAQVSDEDIRKLAKRVHEVGGVLLLDAAQSVPHRPVDVQALDVDFLAFSFHKMCGPSGMGALYGRRALLDGLEPFIVGGDTVADTWVDAVEYKAPPGRFEGGLQDYAGMLGARAAIEYVTRTVGLDAIQAHDRALDAYLVERLADLECDHFWLLGPRDPSRRGGIVTMASSVGAIVNAIEREADEQHNIMLRKGMFCANAYLHRRHDRTGTAANNLRASVYLYNTEAECSALCDVVEEVVKNPLDHLDDE